MIWQLFMEDIDNDKIRKEYERNYSSLLSEDDFMTLVKLDPSSYPGNDMNKEPITVGQLVAIGKQAKQGKYTGLFTRCWVQNNEKDFINNPRLKDACIKYLTNRASFDIRDVSSFPSVDSFIKYVLDGITPEGLLDKTVKKKLTPEEKLDNLRTSQFPNIDSLEKFITVADLDPMSDVEHGQVGNLAKNLFLPLVNKGYIKFLSKINSLRQAIKNYYSYQSAGTEFYKNHPIESYIKLCDEERTDKSIEFIRDYMGVSVKESNFINMLKKLFVENVDYIILGQTKNYDVIIPLDSYVSVFTDHLNVPYQTLVDNFGRESKGKDLIAAWGRKYSSWDASSDGTLTTNYGSFKTNRWCTGWGSSGEHFNSYHTSDRQLITGIYRPDPTQIKKNWQTCFTRNGEFVDIEYGNNDHTSKDLHKITFIQLIRDNLDLLELLMDPALNISNWKALQQVALENNITNKKVSTYGMTSLDSDEVEKELPPLVYRSKADIEEYCNVNDCSKQNITSLIIEDGVTEIPAFEFNLFTSLEKIKFSDDVVKIGSRAFSNCMSLSKLKLPQNLKEIGYGAFQNCTSLGGSIRLPISIEKIQQFAFRGYDKRRGLSFTISSQILNMPDKKIEVPSSPQSERDWWLEDKRIIIADN